MAAQKQFTSPVVDGVFDSICVSLFCNRGRFAATLKHFNMSFLKDHFPNGTALTADNDVDVRVLAGGLVALNNIMKTNNEMLRFLCDRYVLDHFDWKSLDFFEYCQVRFKLDGTDHQAFIDYTLPNLTEDQRNAACFEYIKFNNSKSSDDEQV